jgi:hypothetical protein
MKLAAALAAGSLLVSTIGFADSAQSVLPTREQPVGNSQVEQVGNTSLYLIGDQAILGIVVTSTSRFSASDNAPQTVTPQ